MQPTRSCTTDQRVAERFSLLLQLKTTSCAQEHVRQIQPKQQQRWRTKPSTQDKVTQQNRRLLSVSHPDAIEAGACGPHPPPAGHVLLTVNLFVVSPDPGVVLNFFFHLVRPRNQPTKRNTPKMRRAPHGQFGLLLTSRTALVQLTMMGKTSLTACNKVPAGSVWETIQQN